MVLCNAQAGRALHATEAAHKRLQKHYHMVWAAAILRGMIAKAAPKRRVAEAPKQPRSKGKLTLPSKPIFRDAIARSPANAPAPDKQTCALASFSVGCCQHVRLTALTDLATCLRMHCESLLHPMPAFYRHAHPESGHGRSTTARFEYRAG